MPVTIHDKSASSSNKPPAPDPIPAPPLFPAPKVLSDGREIWVSVPQPDKISLVLPIGENVYGKAVSPDLPVPEFLKKVELLVDAPAVLDADVVKKHTPPSGRWVYVLSMGKREARVRISSEKHKTLGQSLRIETNPRKLGPKGFKALIGVLAHGDVLNIQQLLYGARVTRLDIAFDVVGLHVREILVWHKHQGVKSFYVGKDGELETALLHRAKPKISPKVNAWGEPVKITHSSKPAGVAVLSVYDRVKERAAVLKPPPFGPSPVTRIEFFRRRFSKLHLDQLPAIADPTVGFRVGYARSQVANPTVLWDRYCAARYTTDHEAALTLLGLQSIASAKFQKGYTVPKADLIDGGSWEGWLTGLEATGLSLLINASA